MSSRKHGGSTELSNLAHCCARCNRYKGTDIGSISPASGALTRLFNPRNARWADHFALDESRIIGMTEIGKVTVKLLRLNDEERVIERAALQRIGEYARGASSG